MILNVEITSTRVVVSNSIWNSEVFPNWCHVIHCYIFASLELKGPPCSNKVDFDLWTCVTCIFVNTHTLSTRRYKELATNRLNLKRKRQLKGQIVRAVVTNVSGLPFFRNDWNERATPNWISYSLLFCLSLFVSFGHVLFWKLSE